MVPDRSGGQAQFIHNDTTSGYCATHAAISIARSRQEIIQLAEEQGWQARELPRGGFSVIEFWIENQVMIELLTPDMAADYLAVTAKYCRDVNMDKLK
ncbi:hypothetical protein GCM10011352_29660 [Marinobacterium zhoushanense]|uniref:Uncharacterized protein n=2 Tax=Marinobacterium zhoushanense TaxID=1679163 RepID=A0ABQ1KLM9_9GAMM|nr:hypothetical protein GCM10011352_29660 [Marinobacterium zhoushanense]